MLSKITLESPKSNHYSFNRLISQRNVVYFSENTRSCLIHPTINQIEPNLRILCLFLLEQKASIINLQAQPRYEKIELENLYNNIKIEEKEIRNQYLELFDLSGNVFEYSDTSYRIRYPSYDAFAIDYIKCMEKQFVCLSIDRKNNAGILKNNAFLFGNNLSIREEIDNIVYTLHCDASETAYAEAEWRRYTEIIVKLFIENKK